MHAQMQCSQREEDEVIIFLAVTLIQKTYQAAGIQVLHPEPGSQRDKVLILMIPIEKYDMFFKLISFFLLSLNSYIEISCHDVIDTKTLEA